MEAAETTAPRGKGRGSTGGLCVGERESTSAKELFVVCEEAIGLTRNSPEPDTPRPGGVILLSLCGRGLANSFLAECLLTWSALLHFPSGGKS